MNMKEEIEWFSVDDKPPSGSVLLAQYDNVKNPGRAGPAYYFDRHGWMSVTLTTIPNPKFWAHFPKGPQ